MDAIHKIINFGGFTTTNLLSRCIKGNRNDARRILFSLQEEKMIKRVNIARRPGMSNIYGATGKACAMFGRAGSCRLKPLPHSSTAGSLILSHFLLSIGESGYRQILSSQAAKISFLMGKGFRGNDLPQKYIKKRPYVDIKEYLLTGEPFSEPNGFCAVHIDRSRIPAEAQLEALLKRYEKMLLPDKCPISFLVICENWPRANEFEAAGRKLTGNKRVVGGIGGNHPFITGFSIDYSYSLL